LEPQLRGEAAVVELKSEMLRRFFGEWELRRGERRFPSREDFDPYDLKYALGTLTLIEVLSDPLDYRYRLCGSITVSRYGLDLTGKRVSEIPDPALRQAVRAHLDEVLRREEPVARYYDRVAMGRWVIHGEVLALPLSRDNLTIDMVMTAAVHF
jgi:hypothetical protein